MKKRSLEDLVALLEAAVYARRSRAAVTALVRLLDTELPSASSSLANRLAAAASALVTMPSFVPSPGQRIALLERRAQLRRMFANSTLGGGAHLVTQLGHRPQGLFRFDRPEQVDKYMIFCPTEDLEESVVAALAQLPIAAATPVLLSMLAAPSDPKNERWATITTILPRLSEATITPDLFELATRAWITAPALVGPALRRGMLANGVADAQGCLSGHNAFRLVIAADDDETSEKIIDAIDPALREHYRITFVAPRAAEGSARVAPLRDPINAVQSIQALEPDVLWIPSPGTAAWTCALTTLQNAPIQLASDGPLSADDVGAAIVYLRELVGLPRAA